jgi:hypothetical protein
MEMAATASISATTAPIAQYLAVPRLCAAGSRTARSAAGKRTICGASLLPLSPGPDCLFISPKPHGNEVANLARRSPMKLIGIKVIG